MGEHMKLGPLGIGYFVITGVLTVVCAVAWAIVEYQIAMQKIGETTAPTPRTPTLNRPY